MVVQLKRTRVAVVGSGVAGLSTVFNISMQVGYKCEVELFEPSEKVGGNLRGINLEGFQEEMGIPSVCSATQPEFHTFIRATGVKRRPANRSVYVGNGDHVFGSSKLSVWLSIFRAALAAPKQALAVFWTILTFFRSAWKFLSTEEKTRSGLTLGEFAHREKFSQEILDRYLLPLAEVVRPCGSNSVLDLDAYTVIRSLADNYLLSFTSVSWTAFSGKELVDKVIEGCKPKVHLNKTVTKIRHLANGKWCINDETTEFDAVALSLEPSNVDVSIETDNANAQGLLEVCKGVQYEEVVSYYHSDTSVMPTVQDKWTAAHVTDGVVSFWENERNALTSKDVFTTVVTKDNVSRVKLDEQKYLTAPVTSKRACLSSHNEMARARIEELSGAGGFYVCGCPYAVDNWEQEFNSGVRIANVHSDKAIPLVRTPVLPVPRPITGIIDVIKYDYTCIAMYLLTWVTRSRINKGCIGVVVPHHDVVYYGEEGVPTALVQTLDLRSVLYTVMFGEFGWVECCARKWVHTNNFTLLAGYLSVNLVGTKNLIQKFMLKYFSPTQFEFMATYEHIGDFFGCILDETKTFSNALFDNEDEPMEDAQWRKLDRLIDLLTCVDKDSHVLEVGSGWGSFAVRLAQRVGCKVTCVTTSPIEPIFDLAKEGGVGDKIDAVQIDMLDIKKHFGAKLFDAIVMIEVIEETSDRKYDPYFKVMAEAIRDGGQMVMQINCAKYDYGRTASDLIKQYGFIGDDMPTFGDVYDCGAKHGLIVGNCLRVTHNYIYVGRNWMRNFLARSSVKGAVFSELFKDHVKMYLQMVPVFSVANQTHTYQITMDKIGYDPSPLY